MRLRFLRQAPRSGRFRRTAPLCGSHPLQRHKPADIVGEILQADLGFRPHDTDRPYNPTARRGLLSTEHVLDASPNLALLVVRVVLLFRERMIAACTLMKATAQAARFELRFGRGRAIRA